MSWIGELARRNGNISGKLGIFRGGKFASLHSLPSSLRVGVWTSSRSFHALGKFQRWNSSTFSNFTCTIRNSRFFSNFSNSIGASEKTVSLWLFGVSGLVFTMVVLGGVTRLTRSGLSMVDWKPQGGLPPMSEQEWEDEFKKYQNFPEYQKYATSFNSITFPNLCKT